MDFPVYPAWRQRHLTHPGHGRRSAGGGWRGPALENEALQEEVEHKLQVPATSSQFVKDIQRSYFGSLQKNCKQSRFAVAVEKCQSFRPEGLAVATEQSITM